MKKNKRFTSFTTKKWKVSKRLREEIASYKYLCQWYACSRGFSDSIVPLSIAVLVVATSRSKIIVQYFVYHSISVYRFDLLHSIQNVGYSSKHRMHF